MRLAVAAMLLIIIFWTVTLLSKPKVVSTPRSLTSSATMRTNSSPAASLSPLRASPEEAHST
eukprot:13338718-Heterocapsa_arctica.AAC.1